MSTSSKMIVGSMHASLGITTPSNHAMQHMASAVDGGNITEACLRASLIRSDAYRTSVRTRFRDACYALLGDDDEPAFGVFEHSAGHSAGYDPVEVSDEQIELAVRHGTRFGERYVDLIRRNFSMLMNGELPSDTFEMTMLTRFRDDPTFRIDDLQSIIRSMPTSAELSPAWEIYSIEQAMDLPQLPTPPPTPTPTTSPMPRTVDPDVIQQVLLVGDREYGRPWYALELIAYMEECAVISDVRALRKHVTRLLSDHVAAWECARGIHGRLLGDVLEETDFVRKYVGRHREVGFEATMTGEIICSPVYGERIRGRINSVQMRLYDMELNEDDLYNLVQKAKSGCAGVAEEDVSSIVHAHRRECDALISEVVGVYVDVLSREPDQTELDEEVKRFRTAGAVAISHDDALLHAARVELAVRLSKGFEFHDVIKTRLRLAFHQASGGVHIAMQTMYVMLERVLGASEATLRSHSGSNGLATIVDLEVRGHIPNA